MIDLLLLEKVKKSIVILYGFDLLLLEKVEKSIVLDLVFW
jgi:hypothetical protein